MNLPAMHATQETLAQSLDQKIPWKGHNNSLQYNCPENNMGRRAWWATVHRVAQILTRLKQLSMHACMNAHIAFL